MPTARSAAMDGIATSTRSWSESGSCHMATKARMGAVIAGYSDTNELLRNTSCSGVREEYMGSAGAIANLHNISKLALMPNDKQVHEHNSCWSDDIMVSNNSCSTDLKKV